MDERFWSKVGPANEKGCRLWLGAKRRGYGTFFVGDFKHAPAHGVAWRLTYHGPVRPDREAGRLTPTFRHFCDNPPCCEPSHVYPGTQAQNMEDASRKGRMGCPPPKRSRGPGHSAAIRRGLEIGRKRGMAYTVLDSEFAASTMLKHGPDVVAIWMLLLATTDKLGESYMQPSAAAGLLRITDERAEAAFEILKAPDPGSKNAEYDGRRIIRNGNGKWLVVSHGKYQARASRSWATERQKAYLRRIKKQQELVDGEAEAQERVEAFAGPREPGGGE